MCEGGGPEDFLWESNSRGLSISDNSGGSEEGILGKNPANSPKLMGLNSNDNNKNKEQDRAAPSKKRDRARVGGKVDGKIKISSCEVKEDGKNGDGDGDGGGCESEHAIHIWTERERRKKMRNMFSNLQALLPQLPHKADKATIVDEAVSYIKTLQHTLQKLQKQKLERLQGVTNLGIGYETSAAITPQNLAAFRSREAIVADQGSCGNLVGAIDHATSNSSNLQSVSPYPAIFRTWTSSNVVLNICGDKALISICSPKKPGLFSTICYVLEKHKIEVISAQVSSDFTRRMYMIQAHVNGASDHQFTGELPAEEIYKQAAGEVMLWISS